MSRIQEIPSTSLLLDSVPLRVPISSFYYIPGVTLAESSFRTVAAVVYRTLEIHLFLSHDDLLELDEQVLERCSILMGLACYLSRSQSKASSWFCLIAFWTIVSNVYSTSERADLLVTDLQESTESATSEIDILYRDAATHVGARTCSWVESLRI